MNVARLTPISTAELERAIQQWVRGGYSTDELLAIIQAWASSG